MKKFDIPKDWEKGEWKTFDDLLSLTSIDKNEVASITLFRENGHSGRYKEEVVLPGQKVKAGQFDFFTVTLQETNG